MCSWRNRRVRIYTWRAGRGGLIFLHSLGRDKKSEIRRLVGGRGNLPPPLFFRVWCLHINFRRFMILLLNRLNVGQGKRTKRDRNWRRGKRRRKTWNPKPKMPAARLPCIPNRKNKRKVLSYYRFSFKGSLDGFFYYTPGKLLMSRIRNWTFFDLAIKTWL